MVLGKMLMEIDPLPMRGLMVMTMVTISPSQRDVSLAEQLRRSPRSVPPRFRLVVVEFRPVSLLLIFFPRPKTPYSQRWASEGHQGAHEAGAPRGVGRAPTLVAGGWPPLVLLALSIFLYILEITSVKFQDFWSCAE